MRKGILIVFSTCLIAVIFLFTYYVFKISKINRNYNKIQLMLMARSLAGRQRRRPNTEGPARRKGCNIG